MSYSTTGNGGGGTKSSQKNNNGTQSSTAKSLNGVNLDRNDLIKLLGVLEGELQAREVVIAVLKSEQIKHLIYPVGPELTRPGPRNPLTQLWQDVLGAHDKQSSRIELNSINNLQQVQAKLLENMISQNNELLQKIKERCCADCMNCSAFHNPLSFEQIINKEAKSEAEKVLERETKASAVLDDVRHREKQIVLLLLNERQRLLQKLETTRSNCQELLKALREERLRNNEMVDGLEEESKRSLLMEEQMECASKQYYAFRRHSQAMTAALRVENDEQKLEIERLKLELEKLSASSGAVRSQVVHSTAPARTGVNASPVPATPAQKSVAEELSASTKSNRPTPPPVPPNKPVILRKPAYLTGNVQTTTTNTQAATSVLTTMTAENTLDSEIQNFQNVLGSLKSSTTPPSDSTIPSAESSSKN